MDKEMLIKKMNDFQNQGIENYSFEKVEDIVLIISGLRGLNQFDIAINLYQKFENILQSSDIYPAALSVILQTCNDCNNLPLLIKYAKKLKTLYPDHPFLIELSKFHSI